MKYIFLVAAIFVAGCGTTPTTQIAAFGSTASAISEKVDAVMGEYNNAALQRKFTDFASSYNGDHAVLLTTIELAKIDKPMTPAQKKTFAIYKANRALGLYSSSLSELALAGSRVDIDMAAANLYGAMSNLNEQHETLKGASGNLFDKKDVAAVSKLIAGIGSAVVEEKRNAAIKGIIINADKSVSIICDEIINQLEVAKIEDGISTSRQYVLIEELIDYRSKLKKDTSLEWRRNEVERLYNLQQDVFNSKLLVQQTIKAIQAIKKSHSTMAKELKEDRFTSAKIAFTIGRLKSLEKHYDDFESTLLSCTNITKDAEGILSCDDK